MYLRYTYVCVLLCMIEETCILYTRIRTRHVCECTVYRAIEISRNALGADHANTLLLEKNLASI